MVLKKNLTLSDERPYFKPFVYPWAYDAWLAHEKSHWLFTEQTMVEDVKDWKYKLSNEEKHFLTHIFRFFTQGDIDVAGGYVKNYLPYFPQPEIRMMLLGFAARECIHIGAYSYLIETLGLPDSTYNEFTKYKEMFDKYQYVEKIASNRGSKSDIARSIALFSAFTEGMQLFSSFIMLLNFPRRGTMRGMGQLISWSIVDESAHTDSMIRLFKEYVRENMDIWDDTMKSSIYEIATKMVELEDGFVDLAFSTGGITGLSAPEVKQYIKYIADRRLISLGLKGIFKVKKNPLPWVEDIINSGKHSNFFEIRAIDYAKGALSGSWDDVWGKTK